MSTIPRIERITVGATEILALVDGARDYLPITEAFPDAPADELLAYRHDHGDLYGSGGAWHLIVRAWVVRHAEGTLLVDTGVGTTIAPIWFGADGDLEDLLQDIGVSREEIDTVVITHVHDDHIGGTVTREGTVTFPGAQHLIQRADWEWARRSAAAEDRAIWRVLLAPLQEANLVRLVNGDIPLAGGVNLRHLPGHTPGHQVVEVGDDPDRVVITADAFNHPGQIACPDWSNLADEDPSGAAESRRRILSELALRPETIMAPSHFMEAFGTIGFGDGTAWLPLDQQAEPT